MRSVFPLLVMFGVALLWTGSPRPAEARPQYHQALMKKYEGVKDQARETKCAVCHGGKNGVDKTVISDYGKALLEALDLEKNDKGKYVMERDYEKISEAMGKIEDKKPSEDSPKTYGEMLKAGELPPPAKDEK